MPARLVTGERPGPEIFFVPVGANVLLYAPLARAVALVNRDGLRGAAAALREPGSPLPPALAAIAPMLDPPARTPRACTGPCTPRSLGLITTRACDMGCVYCDFHERLGAMDERVAFGALAWAADRKAESGGTRLDVQLFGGEPFLRMALVKRIAARAERLARERGLAATLGGCTGGIADEEDARWVAERFDALTLSLDGPPEVQDRQRPMKDGGGSSRRADRTARILSDGPCDLALRVCVTAESVEGLERTARWITDRYAPSTVVVEPVRGARGRGGPAPPDPDAFVRGFAAASRHLATHGVQAVHASARIGDVHASFCPAGDDGFIVAPDGRVSACYLPEQEWLGRGLDLAFGRVSPAGEVEVRAADLERIRSLVAARRARCETCFCRWHCAGGCHVAAEGRGVDAPSCRQTRAITLLALLAAMGLEEEADRFLLDPVVRDDGRLSPGRAPPGPREAARAAGEPRRPGARSRWR